MKPGRQAGFSLIELLIVVAVILIIAAIAVPNYLSARMAANEGSAVASLRTMNTALAVYVTAYPSVGYPTSLADLKDSGVARCTPSATQACLIDGTLAAGTKSGYTFTYTPDTSMIPSPAYILVADPISRGISGRRSFYTDQPGVIRYNASAPATVTDPPIPM